MNPKSGYNQMDLSDIEGARPKKQFVNRYQAKKFGETGAQIIDSTQMKAAGGN